METAGTAGAGGCSSWLCLELSERGSIFIPCCHRRVVAYVFVLPQSPVGSCKISL